MKKNHTSQSAFLRPPFLVCLVFCVLGLLLALAAFFDPSASAQGAKPNQNTRPTHKVSVSDRQLLAQLQSQGARVVADYGAFVLVEANESVTKGLAADAKAQIVDENNSIMLNAGAIDTSTAAAQALRTMVNANGGKDMRLIQFAGPIRPEWYQALAATGVRIVTYIPSNSYLVYGTPDRLQAVQNLAASNTSVQWEGPYTAAYRIDPAVRRAANSKGATVAQPNLSESGNEQFVIQMVDDPDENKATLALIDRLKLEPIIEQASVLGYVNVKVALPKDAVISQIAERVDVVSIQQWVTPVMLCERQDQIMAGNLTGNVPTPGDYLAYLTSKGFNLSTIAGFGVNVSDTGLDNGTTTPNMFLLYRLGDSTLAADSRVSYVSLTGTAVAADLQGCNGHGNLNCTIIGGYVPTGTVGGVNFAAFPHADASGFRWGLGIAPFVKVGLSVIFQTSGTFTNPNYETLESNAYAAGMRISSNSWGAAVSGAYNTDSQRYDALVRDAQSGTAGNQEYTIVFSAGNSGSGAQTIGAPGTGKNVITVGAGEDVNPFGGSDGSGVGDSGADNANDIISFSSRGPTADQRKKPEIMGPGTHVSGGAPQNASNPARSGNGNILSCFTGNGVSGGVGSKFFPAGQTWYTASSGTSHSCPAIAGTVALYRQYFIDHGMTPPSPALNKALLIDEARYMNGVGANDALPSNNQGMGEANLNNFLDILASPNVIRDEVAADLFTATGQTRTFAGTISSSAKPFRVTLAWTEPPGPTSGNTFINNLDLEVTVNGTTYKGNVFTGAFSSAGGTADIRDNFESVFLPAGTTGAFSVKVIATNIAGDGVPGVGGPLDQDFALIISNAAPSAPIVISASGSSIVSAGPNGTLDPGETVTVSLGLQNFGSGGCTSALTAALQPTGGVTSPSAPQNYGAVCSPGAAVFKNYTFTVDPPLVCGSSVTATLALQDGATNYGTAVYTFPTGNVATTAVQNFDGVVAPALPAGWTTTFSGSGTAVGTSTTSSDTAPNDAFLTEATAVGLSELTSPAIAIPGPGTQLSFRNLFNTESTYDGLVLEISINGGPFSDIVTAGGSFASGGYNSALNTGFGNPLPGRSAWTGLSGGTAAAPTYITTVVNLPAAAAGQNIQLKWRQGSDSSVAPTNPGSRVDTITLNALVCDAAAPIPVSAVSRKMHGALGPFDISLPLVGVSGAVATEPRNTSGSHTLVVTFANTVTVGSVTVTTGVGTATYSVSGAVVTINLTGITDQQRVGVTLANVNDGTSTGDVVIPIGFLAGDVTGDRSVSASDVSSTKVAAAAGTVNASTFRADLNVNGTVNASDVAVAKANSGHSLP